MENIRGEGAYESGSKRKKLLVPIIALMLCAVAVIGAGYAYQSSLSVEKNTLNAGDLSVDFDGAPGLIFDDAEGEITVTFVQDVVLSGSSYSKNIYAKVDESDKVKEVNLSVSNNLATDQDLFVKISGTGIDEKVKSVITNINVKVTTANPSLMDVVSEGVNFTTFVEGSQKIASVKSGQEGSAAVTLTFTIPASAVYNSTSAPSGVDDVISGYVDAIKGASFNVLFTIGTA